MDLALIALSARPLASSAARAGFAALSFDLFADLDTCAHVARCVKVHKKNGYAFDGEDLLRALETLAPAGLPVVFGGGLDDDPDLMARIAERNPILGNAAQTVRVLKDPIALSALCGHLGVPVPEIALEAPSATLLSGAVLEKKIGGSGGAHIRRRAPGDAAPPAPSHYLQAEVAGDPYSVLLLANGTRALVVGASRQLFAADETHPFRYGGAMGPTALPAAFDRAIREAAVKLALSCGLVGLVSVDLIIADDRWWLVEVNPRLGATLDVFDVDPLPPLMGLHLAACGGRLPDSLPAPSEAHAVSVLYAPCDIVIPAGAWPDYVVDRPPAGAHFLPGAPICSIKAMGPTLAAAQEHLRDYIADVKARLGFPDQQPLPA